MGFFLHVANFHFSVLNVYGRRRRTHMFPLTQRNERQLYTWVYTDRTDNAMRKTARVKLNEKSLNAVHLRYLHS